MDEPMVNNDSTAPSFCHQIIAILALVWLGAAPIVSRLAIVGLLPGTVSGRAAGGLSVVVAAAALIGPFAGACVLTKRWAGAKVLVGLSAALGIASGYIVLSAGVEAALPRHDVLIPLRTRYAAAAVHVGTLGVYTAIASWVASRVACAPRRSLLAWLGFETVNWPTFLVAFAASAWIAMPWPLTGALGDGPTSLALGVQVLFEAIPQLFIFWGVVFQLLSSSFRRRWASAAVTILIYALSAAGGFLRRGDWMVLSTSLFLLPLGLFLTEMRVRGRGVLPLLPLALSYRATPLLFVDPRDVAAKGIPEPQHVLGYLVVWVAASLASAVLLVGRRLAAQRSGQQGPGLHAGVTALLPVVAGSWALWVGLYLYAGEPGFSNDGFLMILEQQADLGPATSIADHQARRVYVYETLVAMATVSQSPLRDELDSLGVPYRPYYIINMIRVDGHRRLMERFQRRPGVAQVVLNPNVRRYPLRIPVPYAGAEGPSGGLQDNLAAVRADAAWALGATGEGIVVGGQDTGYEWDHPALKAQYRGWDGEDVDHNTCWHDAWDHSHVPFDDESHGTHTMGTVLGDDGGANRTGVAPRAEWIGCRSMRRGFGNPGSYAECMEFLLAPYPLDGDPFLDGDPGRGADLTNNSWGCPRFEGCLPETLEPAVKAVRAAGIMMVVSAGNEGPGCATAATPPANYAASFCVGAVSNDGDVLGFSSRGPADGQTKPDIAAPGQLVRSSVNGGRYAYAGGTSMAGPHVAGTVALVWSVAPALVGEADATEALLCETAVPKPVDLACPAPPSFVGPFASLMPYPACACGSRTGVPNNVYGCGIVDAGAAVNKALDSW